MEVNQSLNLRKPLKFVSEQVIFSISSFVFLRNFLKELEFETAGHVGIYLVATYSILSMTRPLGLKAFSQLTDQKELTSIGNLELKFLKTLKYPLILAGFALISIGLTIETSNHIRFLLPSLGLLFILNDFLRTQNIVNGNPGENMTGNTVVLFLSLGSFLAISKSNEFLVLYLWIFSQITFFIILWISRKNSQITSRIDRVDFTKIGNLLSLESFLAQTFGFLFIFWLTGINADFSGQFRVATSAFATIPILFFSALASPYSIQIAAGNVEVRNQVFRLSITLMVFAICFFTVTRIDVIGLLLAGRETRNFERGIAPAFVVATLVTLISHITHSYANKLAKKFYILIRVVPIVLLYALIILTFENLSSSVFEKTLLAYLLSSYLFIVVILKRYGAEHNVIG